MQRFRAGQKVQFVTYQAPWYWAWAVTEPRGYFTVGQVFTVAAVESRWFGLHQLLHFTTGPRNPGGYGPDGKWVYPGWLNFHFREVAEQKAKTTTATGMEILRKVAADASKKRVRVRNGKIDHHS